MFDTLFTFKQTKKKKNPYFHLYEWLVVDNNLISNYFKVFLERIEFHEDLCVYQIITKDINRLMEKCSLPILSFQSVYRLTDYIIIKVEKHPFNTIQ